MAIVVPFRALTYAPKLRRDLDALVAPPYDVLGEAQRTRLGERHPNNIVHLDLPRSGGGDGAYTASAGLLHRWIAEGVLVHDATPALYACEQRYVGPDGASAVRRGFFARLTLEPFGSGSIVPHERTLDAPRRDRTRLLAATRTHLSAVFLLHPDPGAVVASVVKEALAGPIDFAARDDDGTESRVSRLADPGRIETVAAALRTQWALIADGHHRYESALAYREERRAAGADDARHVLAFLCSVDDPGLAIFPIHRLVHSVEGFDEARFRERLARWFRLTEARSPSDLGVAVAERSDRPGVFGLLFPGHRAWLAEWIAGRGLDTPGMTAVPGPLRTLDVVLLHRLVLEEALGIGVEAQARQQNLEYVKDENTLRERAHSPDVQVTVLMNPTRLDQVIAVTQGGARLPQKSTYFYPKVLTGLVLDPLD